MLGDLNNFEGSLWEAADQLRANSKLNATEYYMPVLGLIFLRHATNRFDAVKADIAKTLPSRGGKTRPITQDDFKGRAAIFLPEKSHYDFIAGLPSDQDLGEALNNAMRFIEDGSDMLKGVLPKDYNKFDKKLLEDLVRIFNREVLRSAQGDVFGRIYEYFLNKFAMTGAQEGGEFFTPPSLVRTIVNAIEPNHGLVFDPACGSAGMIVQSGHFISALEKNPGQVARFVGQEKSETNTRISRMNMAVHGLEGEIRLNNTYYERCPDLIGKCDFVMANPPFNVDGVDPARVEDDPRLFTKKKIPGVTKPKKDDKSGGQKPAGVSNANYLWIQYFYSYLNEKGRAGFVMAASATDAGHGEKDIRKEIIETGDVDAIISIGTNFFYTRTLPCTLWFFDRSRSKSRRNQTLMLDTRNIFRVVTRTVHDFSEEQLSNVNAIIWLYRGEEDRYLKLVQSYLEKTTLAVADIPKALAALNKPLDALSAQFKVFSKTVKTLKDAAQEDIKAFGDAEDEQSKAIAEFKSETNKLNNDIEKWLGFYQSNKKSLKTNAEQKGAHKRSEPLGTKLKAVQKQINEVHKLSNRAIDIAIKQLGAGKIDAWDNKAIREQRLRLDETRQLAVEAVKMANYVFGQITWLQSRFPDAKIQAVPGLCKVVTSDEIQSQDFSLTPGRYVGAAPPEIDDNDDFEERMREIHVELQGLNDEAIELAKRISANFEELIG